MSESKLFEHHPSSHEGQKAIHAELNHLFSQNKNRHAPTGHHESGAGHGRSPGLTDFHVVTPLFLHMTPIGTLLDHRIVDTAKNFTTSKSIAQLCNEHLFKMENVQHKDPVSAEHDLKRSVPVQKISIVYSNNATHKEDKQTSFQINKQGVINVLADPDKHNNKTLVIRLERSAGDLNGPNQAEQVAVSKLVNYLSAHFSYNDATHRTLHPLVEDAWSVLRSEDKKRIDVAAAPEDALSNHAKKEVQKLNRFEGAGKGYLSHRELDSYFPGGKAQGDATSQVCKDVIAGMASGHESQPYSAVGTVSDGNIGVGRYMLTYTLLSTWLELNPSKAAEMETRPSFNELIEELKNNKQPPSSLIESALPVTTQETITDGLISFFKSKTGLPGSSLDDDRIALAFYLGHVPDKLELADSTNRCFMNSANQLKYLAAARVYAPDESVAFQTKTDTSGCSTLALKLAASVQREASGSHAHGACSHYVRLAFDKVDPKLNDLFAGSAKNDHLSDDPRFKVICDNLSELSHVELQPGDTIVYGPKNDGTGQAGHIETMGLDGDMYSDFRHPFSMRFAENYSSVRVFRPTA